MRKLKILLVPFAGLFIIMQGFSCPLNAQSWNLAGDKDGIKIYTCLEAGNSIKSYKGVADIAASPEQVFALVENVYDHDWWGKNLSQVRVDLYEKDKRSRYYLEYRLPWPLSNRDMFVEATIKSDPVNRVYRTSAVQLPGIIPEYPGKVRMPTYRQSWVITPAGSGSSHVVLEGCADPAGNIPDWITNLAIVDTPVSIIKAVRQRVEKKPMYFK